MNGLDSRRVGGIRITELSVVSARANLLTTPTHADGHTAARHDAYHTSADLAMSSTHVPRKAISQSKIGSVGFSLIRSTMSVGFILRV